MRAGANKNSKRTKKGGWGKILLECSDVSRTAVCLARTQGPLQSDNYPRKAGHLLEVKIRGLLRLSDIDSVGERAGHDSPVFWGENGLTA